MSDGNLSPGTACNRREERHRIQQANNAFVSFDLPEGRRWCLPILDLSRSGVSFGLEDELGALQTGAQIPQGVVTVDEHEIRCSLTVLHVTVGLSTGMICGARIHPHADVDRATLESVVRELERSAPPV